MCVLPQYCFNEIMYCELRFTDLMERLLDVVRMCMMGKGEEEREARVGRERREVEIHREATRESFVLLAHVFKPSSDFLDS